MNISDSSDLFAPNWDFLRNLQPQGPTLLRAKDLLVLRFTFLNLQIVKGPDVDPSLERINPDNDAYIIINFQPQHIAEEFTIETSQATDPKPPPIQARIARDSRLVYRLPDGTNAIPYTVESLLDWTQFEISLAATALPPNPPPSDLSPRPQIQKPSPTETAIEFPYKLFISPNRTAAWAHSLIPVTHNGRTELWHSRLGVLADSGNGEISIDENDSSTRTLRAIWSSNFNNQEANPFDMPMTDEDRYQIVRLTSDYGIWAGGFVLPGGKILVGSNFQPIEASITLTNLNITEASVKPIQTDSLIRDTTAIDQKLIDRILAGDREAANLSPDLVHSIIDGSATISPNLINALLPLIQYYEPIPVKAEQFMLSSQGAWARLRGAWPGTQLLIDEGLDLVDWRHIATQGRDQYVRLIKVGYLYPWGHKTVQIEITERKAQKATDGTLVATLRKRTFLVIREPEKSYDTTQYNYDGREMPFYRLIRFTTLITPNLDAIQDIGGAGSGAYWINVGGKPFIFQMEAEDCDGNTFHLEGGAIFMEANIFAANNPPPNQATILSDVEAAYLKKDNGVELRRFTVPNHSVAYATKNEAKDGDTRLNTRGLYFNTQKIDVSGFPYIPALDKAEVQIPAADQIAGNQGLKTIQLYEKYLNSAQGLEDTVNNAGAVFAKFVNNSNIIQFAAEQAGGLATPNFDMSGLSQDLGPVAGVLDTVAKGEFNPQDFFKNVKARLLGAINLADIIQTVAGQSFGDQFPALKINNVTKKNPPELIEAVMEWKPQVKPFGVFVTDLPGQAATKLDINVRIRQNLKAATVEPPSATVRGLLTDFQINLVDIILINFTKLEFIKEGKKKLDVNVVIPDDGIKFGGPLEFLNELEKYLDPASFSDPPVLDVGSNGVTVGYTLQLPPLAIGVFTLKDVGLGAALSLPFGGSDNDRMRLRFNLSERHNPFNLAVMIFAGGGFFAITMGADGVEVLEVALEFGGSASLDIGVASGGISVMAGIYFKIVYNPERAELSAYLRMNGYLSVLGLINVSVEFYMALTYKKLAGGKSKLTGHATVKVKVEVLLFHTTVSMTVQRKFSGSANDPTFTDMLEPSDWYEYGEAFA